MEIKLPHRCIADMKWLNFNIIVTGHSDGTIAVWDIGQLWVKSSIRREGVVTKLISSKITEYISSSQWSNKMLRSANQ